jgi:hypothetical protein
MIPEVFDAPAIFWNPSSTALEATVLLRGATGNLEFSRDRFARGIPNRLGFCAIFRFWIWEWQLFIKLSGFQGFQPSLRDLGDAMNRSVE